MVPFHKLSVESKPIEYITHLITGTLDEPSNAQIEHEVHIAHDIELYSEPIEDLPDLSDHSYCMVSREFDAANALMDLNSGFNRAHEEIVTSTPICNANTLENDRLAYVGGYIA